MAALASAYDELGHRMIDRLLDDKRNGTLPDSFAGEGVAVGALAADAKEERAGDDGPRVVRELMYLDGGDVGHGRRSEHRDDSLQVHAGRVYQRHSVVPKASIVPEKCAICGSFHTQALARERTASLRSQRGGGWWPPSRQAVLTGRG